MTAGAQQEVPRQRERVFPPGTRALGAVAISLTLILASLVGLVGLVGSSESSPVYLDFSETSNQLLPREHPVQTPLLRVAVAPMLAPEAALSTYGDLVDRLAEGLGERGRLLICSSYSEANEMLRNRQCDIAFVCTYAFVLGEETFGMRLVAAPRIDGASTYRSALIVNQRVPASSILDLRGMRFASADLLSNSGWIQPALTLLRHEEDPANFFARHLVAGSHDRAVRAVALGVADAASVDELIYRQMTEVDPEVESQTRIISRSEPFAMPPIVSHRQLPEERFRRIQQALLDLHQTEQGRAALANSGIDRFELPPLEAYDAVRAAAKTWSAVVDRSGRSRVPAAAP